MVTKENGQMIPNGSWRDEEKNVEVDMTKINRFRPFERGMAIFGAFFGDEGKRG